MTSLSAVCLTTEIGDHDHVIIAFVSSRIPDNPLDSDIVIRLNSAEAVGTGLVVDSVIKLHRMVTIPKSLIKRRLGHISAPIQVLISEKIKALFERA